MKKNTVHTLDFLANTLADKSVSLIISDPPYFQVKGKFDFVWDSFVSYLETVELWAKECKRLLKDNGTLLWYGDRKKIAYSQIILDKYFNLEENIVWQKTGCQTLKCNIDSLTSFVNVTERILMYSNEIIKSGLEAIHDNPNLFLPIKQYLREQRALTMEKYGFKTKKEFNDLCAMCTTSKYFVARHCFEDSQFNLIGKIDYELLAKHTGFFQRPYETELRNEYEGLRNEYEGLRNEYEGLRRFFNASKQYRTNVLKLSQQAHITQAYKHPTKKPNNLTEIFITACSRPNDLILIPFAGSGTECAMAASLNRDFIGFEINSEYAEMSNKRVLETRRQMNIFQSKMY